MNEFRRIDIVEIEGLIKVPDVLLNFELSPSGRNFMSRDPAGN